MIQSPSCNTPTLEHQRVNVGQQKFNLLTNRFKEKTGPFSAEPFCEKMNESDIPSLRCYFASIHQKSWLDFNRLHFFARLLVETEFDATAKLKAESVEWLKQDLLKLSENDYKTKIKVKSLFFLSQKIREHEGKEDSTLSFIERMRKICERHQLTRNFEIEEQKFYKHGEKKALQDTTERIFVYLENKFPLSEITLLQKINRIGATVQDEDPHKIIKRADKIVRWAGIQKSFIKKAAMFDLGIKNKQQFRLFISCNQAYLLRSLTKREASHSSYKWVADALPFLFPASSDSPPLIFATNKIIDPFNYKTRKIKTREKSQDAIKKIRFNQEIQVITSLQDASVVQLAGSFSLANSDRASAMLLEKAGKTLRLENGSSTQEQRVVDLYQALTFYIQNNTTIYTSKEFYSFLPKLVESVLSVIEKKIFPTDLKLENFLLKEEQILLCDLDLGSCSPFYNPPEVVCFKAAVDEKALSWTIGVIIHQFSVNQLDAHPISCMNNDIDLKAFHRLLREFNQDKPAEVKSLKDLVNSTIQFKPEDRPTLRQILDYLNELNPHKR